MGMARQAFETSPIEPETYRPSLFEN